MHTFTQMMAQGYRCGAPSVEAQAIDAEIAAGIKCPRCGAMMHYEGWSRRANGYLSYIALAVCSRCGYELEF